MILDFFAYLLMGSFALLLVLSFAAFVYSMLDDAETRRAAGYWTSLLAYVLALFWALVHVGYAP